MTTAWIGSLGRRRDIDLPGCVLRPASPAAGGKRRCKEEMNRREGEKRPAEPRGQGAQHTQWAQTDDVGRKAAFEPFEQASL
jgi:hypothetical protein